MKMLSITIISAIAMLLGCNHTNSATPDHAGRLLDSLDIVHGTVLQIDTLLQVGDHTLTHPDSVSQVNCPTLDEAHCDLLARQSGMDLPHGVQFVGMRDIGNGMTLAAYRVPDGGNGEEFKVCLMTHANDGAVIDAIGLGAFHACESKQPRTFGGNRFYTLDSEVAFDGERHFTLRRTATFSGLYLKDHRVTPLWRADWENAFDITADGHFRFTGQRETYRSPDGIDEERVNACKACDMELFSR